MSTAVTNAVCPPFHVWNSIIRLTELGFKGGTAWIGFS